jgi:hypothetical protein
VKRPWAPTKVDVSTKSSAIFSRNFILLILTFVTVSVQIKGLNYDKPHPKGFTLTPRSRKVIEYEKAKQNVLFKSCKLTAKKGVKRSRKSGKTIKRRKTCYKCHTKRQNEVAGCVSRPSSTGLTRLETSKGASYTSEQISHFIGRNKFPISIGKVVAIFQSKVSQLNECIRRYWGKTSLYKMSYSTINYLSTVETN